MITDPSRLLPAHYKHRIKCASYLEDVVDPDRLQGTIDYIISNLHGYNYDAIAFRGLSGMLVAPIVALKLHKTILAVRKSDEDNHSGRMVEGDYNARRYVIIDDIVSSGQTVRDIVELVAKAIPDAECIGVLQYLRWADRGLLSVKSLGIR